MYKKVTIFLLFVGLFAIAAQAQQDPFLGTWKQNMAKSSYDPANLTPRAGTTLKREAWGTDGWKLTTDGMDAQGNKTHEEYSAKFDGKDYPRTGSQDYNMQSLKKIDSNTVVTVAKKNGTVVRMIRGIVSKDGKTYSTVSVGYNAQGVAYHNVTVFDKQ